jgi:hypothetical protein
MSTALRHHEWHGVGLVLNGIQPYDGCIYNFSIVLSGGSVFTKYVEELFFKKRTTLLVALEVFLRRWS